MRAKCTICSDLFDEINPISAAKCGHVYHSSCLAMWIDHSKSCPHCRARITVKDIQKLYFDFPPKSDLNTSELENEILNLKAQLSAKDAELVACKKDKADTVVFVREAERRASELQQKMYKNESELIELRLRLKSATKLESKLLKLEQMNVALTNDLELLNNVRTIINGTQKDTENILNEYNNHSEVAKQLATYCTCLKRELQKVMESKSKLTELNSKLKRENGLFAAKVKSYEDARAISNNMDKSAKKITPSKSPMHLNENSSYAANNVPSTSSNFSDDITISPLTVPFSKAKFNVNIKTSISTCKSDKNIRSVGEQRNASSLVRKLDDDNSVIRIGYNGFGGHSNFINITTGGKKLRTIKRKT